jgi:protein-tyrosine kinase
MGRIYEALARARTLTPAEDVPGSESEVRQSDALPPSAPAEWTFDQTIQPLWPVQASVAEPIRRHVGSNGDAFAKVWSFSQKLKEKLVLENGVDHAAIEQYRRLAAVLHLAQSERGPDKTKIIMISSSVPAEGKSLTCVNLGLTLSESYQRSVLLVDGDLRRPWLHEAFQVPNGEGLNDSLTSHGKIPVLQISPKLSLVTAGRPAADPMRVLTSERMEHFLQQARERFDWILLDTPPITLLSDASLLASKADLVILVVEAGKTDCNKVQRAVDAVGRDRIVGIVLNRVQSGRQSGYAYGQREGTDEPTLHIEGN